MPFLKMMLRHVLQNVLIFFLGVFLSLLLLETGIRLGGFIMTSMQDYENWRTIKQNGTYRILCIGESTTQGHYPKVLERILNERDIGVRFSVVDKGRAGANSCILLKRLDADLAEYRPHMVVAMMGINDAGVKYYQDISASHSWAFEHLRVFKLFQILWMNFLKKLQHGNAYNSSGADSNASFSLRGGQMATEELRKVSAEKPSLELDSSNDYFLSGQRLAKQRELSLAKSFLGKSIALNPENDNAYVELGRLLFRGQGELLLAEDSFRKALNSNPKNDQACSELGWVNAKQGEYQLAKQFFLKAIEINSKNDSAYCGLGWVYRGQGEWLQAEAFFKKALAINVQNDDAFSGMGMICRDRGEISKAEAFFKKAVELNPDNSSPLYQLVWLHRSRGEFTQAKELLEKVVELGTEKTNRKLRAMASLDVESSQAKGGVELGKKVAALDLDYSAMTFNNYHKLRNVLGKNRIKLVCVQYPMRSLAPLKKIFEGKKDVVFVDNEQVFKDALKKMSYKEYFKDMFGGDFGHCTPKGNELLAQNIADVILKEVFSK